MKFTTEMEVTHTQLFEFEGECFKSSEGAYYIPLPEVLQKDGLQFLCVNHSTDSVLFVSEFLEMNWHEITACDIQEGITAVQEYVQRIEGVVKHFE